ncbi:MAG TPA: Gfo/Idh/MocA family oxidoreductase [Abditibacterium sp.]
MISVPRVAIIGLGGFARHHHAATLEMERRGELQLVATCDPQPDRFAASQQEWDFAGRGVAVHADYLQMLDAHAAQLDFVTVPTPIPLHAPMHRAVIERGLACYLEKPPTLFWAELEQMIETDQSARFATQVGFNFIVEAPRQALKARLLAGEFGALQSANFLGFWPRSTSYFERAPWAGKLRLDGRLVLDSCAGNALAHHVHDALFWCGEGDVLSWGEVEAVEALLLRAHAIESFDTVFARARCGNAEVRFAATHAGNGASWHREWVECERAVIHFESQNSSYRVSWRDGREEIGAPQPRNLMIENLRHYAAYLRGETARPLTRLGDCRPFVHFNNLLFVAANTIHPVEARWVERAPASDGEWLSIAGIDLALQRFGESGEFPLRDSFAWARSEGRAAASQVVNLEQVVEEMRNS